MYSKLLDFGNGMVLKQKNSRYLTLLANDIFIYLRIN